ncbi:hypothetical protein XFPR_03110 [Xylella fastidiosa]|nr:hypothetical protein ADT30_09430 [Xylella fastidiosa]OJZ72113.1 hypothetical protein B375_0203050 [Xylella fastidiosa 6c]QPB73041.1 hypothetical protein XFPR_03110 [Xylella fastidiosa]
MHDAADTDKENVTVTTEHCFIGVCFIPLDGSGQTFFGFSEFLTGLALMVLAWTIADVRYRFRIQVAPLPLLRMSFYVVAAIGLLTLLTDLWRAEQWLVPRGILLTPAVWQALLGGAFLLTILTWAWLGFIRPPTYGQYNAARFQQTLFGIISNGSPTELAVIADELAHSAEALVQHATNRYSLQNGERIECEEEEQEDLPQVNRDANVILRLIADKRLCRAIVAESPRTAFALFQAIANTKKYGIPIRVFAQNIFHEALANKDSFLYYETGGDHRLSMIAYSRPFAQAMFGNYEMVATIGTSFTPHRDSMEKWDITQWHAYCSVVLMTLRSYAKQGYRGYSFVLSQAMGYIPSAVSGLSSLNEPSSAADSDVLRRFDLVIWFIVVAVKSLDEEGVPDDIRIHLRAEHDFSRQTLDDRIANMICTVISCALVLRSSQLAWQIQYNVWAVLFYDRVFDGPAGQVVAFKLRRLLYNQIADMRRFPDFRGAKILRFCLNVLGLVVDQNNDTKHSRALHKAVLAWTKKHFVWLHSHDPDLAVACLGDGITYDAEHLRLRYTHPVQGPIGNVNYLALNPAPPEPEPDVASAVPNA